MAAWRPYTGAPILARYLPFGKQMSRYGPDRGMFESNFPPDGVSSGYPVLWNAFKRLTVNYSAGEKAKLYSGTAKRVYRLA